MKNLALTVLHVPLSGLDCLICVALTVLYMLCDGEKGKNRATKSRSRPLNERPVPASAMAAAIVYMCHLTVLYVPYDCPMCAII